MVDSMSRKLSVGKNLGIISDMKSTSGVEAINHALSTNDTLLLGGASLRLERIFKDIIHNFCTISGALIKNRKRAVYVWNEYQSSIANISQTLGFDGFVTWDKVKYLGLPLTLGQNNPSLWMEIIIKLKAKIALWGGHWITTVGKLFLINSTLSTLLIYQSSLLLAPKMIMD